MAQDWIGPSVEALAQVLSVWGQFFFVFSVLKGVFLKVMGERLSLSKDERLTPNIGKVMAKNIIHNNPLIFKFRSINWKISKQFCTDLVVI